MTDARCNDLTRLSSRPGPLELRRTHERRIEMLQAALENRRKDGGPEDAKASDRIRTAMAAMERWPGPVEDTERHGLEQVIAHLRSVSAASELPSAAALAPSFARALIAQAVADVVTEARRAGHGEASDALRAWLQREPGADDLSRLAGTLGMSASAVATALRRLRRRFRQRTEAGLALWSATPAQHEMLRRQLHAALTGEERAP